MEPIRVMVVDDAADVRFLVGLMLEGAPDLEIVAEAEGADAALAVVDEAEPDVALVDARMPGTDGYELTRLLLERRPGIRVAMLTSVVDDVVAQQARDAGADVCLSKASLDDLPDALRALARS